MERIQLETMRYFRTPSITSKFDSSKTNLCWRECHQIEDHTHIRMLGLPKVEKLLGGDSERIIVYIEYHLPLTPKFILLEQSLREDGTKRKLYLFHVLLIIARKMITLSWLKPLPPTILQWQERVKRVYIMEKTTVHLRLKMDISKLLNYPV